MNYWKDANDCVADGTADANYGTIYWQSEDSDAIATSFSDIQTQVAVQEAQKTYTALQQLRASTISLPIIVVTTTTLYTDISLPSVWITTMPSRVAT